MWSNLEIFHGVYKMSVSVGTFIDIVICKEDIAILLTEFTNVYEVFKCFKFSSDNPASSFLSFHNLYTESFSHIFTNFPSSPRFSDL